MTAPDAELLSAVLAAGHEFVRIAWSPSFQIGYPCCQTPGYLGQLGSSSPECLFAEAKCQGRKRQLGSAAIPSRLVASAAEEIGTVCPVCLSLL